MANYNFKPTKELMAQLGSFVKCDTIIVEADQPCTLRVYAAQGGKKLFAMAPFQIDRVTTLYLSGIETTADFGIEPADG